VPRGPNKKQLPFGNVIDLAIIWPFLADFRPRRCRSLSPRREPLMKLARRTATAVAATLLPPTTPILLTQPGLIDRYQLVELLRSLVEAAKDDAAEPAAGARPRARRAEDRRHVDPGPATWAVDVDPEGVDRRAAAARPRVVIETWPAGTSGGAGDLAGACQIPRARHVS